MPSFELFLIGIVLGLSAGLTPGPLFTLTISETLKHGAGAGSRVALALFITDLPIMLASVLLIRQLDGVHQMLGVVSLFGAALLCRMGWQTFRTPGIAALAGQAGSGSLSRAILTNLLSPHPYLFWLTVGASYLTRKPGLLAPALFLLGFYLCLIGSKVVLAVSVAYSRGLLSGAALKWVFRVLGLSLGVLAIGLLREGWVLLGLAGQVG